MTAIDLRPALHTLTIALQECLDAAQDNDPWDRINKACAGAGLTHAGYDSRGEAQYAWTGEVAAASLRVLRETLKQPEAPEGPLHQRIVEVIRHLEQIPGFPTFEPTSSARLARDTLADALPVVRTHETGERTAQVFDLHSHTFKPQTVRGCAMVERERTGELVAIPRRIYDELEDRLAQRMGQLRHAQAVAETLWHTLNQIAALRTSDHEDSDEGALTGYSAQVRKLAARRLALIPELPADETISDGAWLGVNTIRAELEELADLRARVGVAQASAAPAWAELAKVVAARVEANRASRVIEDEIVLQLSTARDLLASRCQLPPGASLASRVAEAITKTSNYPEPAQVHVLGRDMSKLIGAVMQGLGVPASAENVVVAAADPAPAEKAARVQPLGDSLADRASIMATNLLRIAEGAASTSVLARSAMTTAAAFLEEVSTALRPRTGDWFWLIDEYCDNEGDTFGIAIPSTPETDAAIEKWARSFDGICAKEEGREPLADPFEVELGKGGTLTFRQNETPEDLGAIADNADPDSYSARIRMLKPEGVELLLKSIAALPPGASLSLYKGVLSTCYADDGAEPKEITDLWDLCDDDPFEEADEGGVRNDEDLNPEGS